MALQRYIIIFFLLISTIHASYSYKKIIVASFPTQESADKALAEIENRLYENDTVLTLQSEHHFDVISRVSGRYFIVTIEPFKDRAVLQQVLDEVRHIKKDAFVNRFVSETDLFANVSEPRDVVVSEPVIAVPVVLSEDIQKKEEKLEAVEPATVLQPEATPTPKAVSTTTVEHAQDPEKEQATILPSTKTSQCSQSEHSILYAGGLAVALLLIYMYFYVRRRMVKLREENAELKRLMRHKDEVFAKSIHELRTPIHGIIGMTHLLKESGVSELYTTPIEKISKASDRMLQLINDFLDFSKLGAKKIELEHIEFDLNDVLESLSDNIGIEANKKGIDFLYQVDSSLPKKYIGDPLRISQILLNLISNAIKFTLKGGVYLTIKEIKRDDALITLEFEVEDSGIGLTQEQIESAFTLFSQTESSTSRVYGGTGLGLAISKELVELMGGSIHCKKARKGEGACFVFTIKLQMYDPNEQRIYRLPSKSMMFKRALIIDTNEQSIEFLTLKLEYFHYNVVTLPSLSEVTKKETHFDLLFLDEMYFDERSVGYLNSIKASYAVKIILVETLYNKMKNSKIPFEFDYKIIKPFSQQRIVDMVVELYSDIKTDTEEPVVEVTLKEQLLQLPPATILLAEDNEINQKVILGLLKKVPIEVIIANNGEEAVSKAREHRNIALIFMDLSMPIMDGFEATKQIKQMSQYEEIPIVALSANVMSQELEKILSVGMEEYLPKPFEMDAFYKLLLRYLS